MGTLRSAPRYGDPLIDDHRVLLWQICAYADDLTDAVDLGHRLTPAYDALLGFLHYRLLPYLTSEERQLPSTRLRDGHMLPLLLTDHERLRGDVDNIESSRTRRVLAIASGTLVERLERHVQREERWVKNATAHEEPADAAAWALPLLLSDEIDLDALPADHRDRLLRQRLAWMRPGDVVHVESTQELHGMWRRHDIASPRSHGWVYELTGPERWRVRITRRELNAD